MRFEELGRILRDIDPATVLVAKPVIARVVQKVTGLSWAIWRVPHSHCFVVDRFTLFKHIDPEELHLPSDHALPQYVLLLERPTPDQLAGNREELLGRYWRLLFHACVHREIERRLEGMTPEGLRERIETIGPAAFEEIRSVLLEDGHLVATADDRATYYEFAAYFLELRFFNPGLIPVCFPRLRADEVAAALARDVDGLGLFLSTRPPGTPDPAPRTDDQSDESHDFYHKLTRQARRAAAVGNTVAAAIIYTRAARVAPAALTEPARESARAGIYTLVNRLRSAIGATDEEAENWRRVLPTLLDKADQGARPVEAAILYDIQRACLDHEEKVYAVDTFGWLMSGGKDPIRQPLDSERFIRVPAQLRTAARRLTAARLSDADRQALAGLIRGAIERAEALLRDRFGPILRDALHDAGLQPADGVVPEQAALEKTVEELLDRIVASGFLTFADVRDAIARGQMKLPDLSGEDEYMGGDPLLRLDKRLKTNMKGVYRRGEVYTRGLEWVTALAFGTVTGRWLVTNIAIPFLGALVLAEFVWMLVFDKRAAVAKKAGQPEPEFFAGWNEEWWFHGAWFALGLFFLSAINFADVRAAVAAVVRVGYRVGRYIFWELPARVWSTPWVRAVIASAGGQTILNLGLKPLAVSAAVWTVFPAYTWHKDGLTRALVFAVAVFVVNTRPGRAAEQLLLTAARGLLDLLASLPAMLTWVNDLFRDLLYALEWMFARTEDWLRLRGRGGPISVATRVVAGIFWMPFAAVVRFYTVVLIEPMINPLKLPLTLLCAKFVYPLLLMMPQVLKQNDSTIGFESPLVDVVAPYVSEPVALVVVLGTLWLLPDAMTYLIWEMRENWRLFRANRSKALKPVAVGPHGETVQGLLHPGFHSGTLPRLYARLRSAEREAARTDNWRDARTYRQALDELAEAVRRFVTRELVAVLNPSKENADWGGPRLGVGQVQLGTNRIRIEFTAAGASESAWLEWEDRSGWLVAGWDGVGFLADLQPGPAREFENALAYLHRRAGVDLIREQLKTVLPSDAHFDIVPNGLLVWFGPRESTPPVLYDLIDPGTELRPLTPVSRRPAQGPTLDARKLMFGRVELKWAEWVGVWAPTPDEASMPGRRPRFGPTDFALAVLPPKPGAPEPLPAPPVPEISPDTSEAAKSEEAMGAAPVGEEFPREPLPSTDGNGAVAKSEEVGSNGSNGVAKKDTAGTAHEPPTAAP